MNSELQHKDWYARFEQSSGLPADTVDASLPFAKRSSELLALYKELVDSHYSQLDTLTKSAQSLIPKIIVPSHHVLTKGQLHALEAMGKWVRENRHPFFVLRGYAGTGKTYVLTEFAKRFTASTLFTAPTNKATKVLRTILSGYKCKTIYSALSLRMVTREDELILQASNDRFNLSGYRLIVIDEASMLNTELLEYVREAHQRFGMQFLFICDEAQLPPVGEAISPVVELDCPTALLDEVVRHDNQILDLATHVRRCITAKKRLRPMYFDPSEEKSVWQFSHLGFITRIKKAASAGWTPDLKALAWRNATVDGLNEVIRAQLYTREQLSLGRWLVGDQIVFAEPVGEGVSQIASTDDDGLIVNSDIGVDPETGLTCYFLGIKLDTEEVIRVHTIHEDSSAELSNRLSDLASAARKPGQHTVWKKFWDLKNRYIDIRHAYATTVHRSQGSTYKRVFVDAGDILANPDTLTAYRCLYVAATRPSDKLYTTGLPR